MEPKPVRPVAAQLEEIVEVHESDALELGNELAERVAVLAVDRADARQDLPRRGTRPASGRDVRRSLRASETAAIRRRRDG